MYINDEKLDAIKEMYSEIVGDREPMLDIDNFGNVSKGIMVLCKLEELHQFYRQLTDMQDAIKIVTGIEF